MAKGSIQKRRHLQVSPSETQFCSCHTRDALFRAFVRARIIYPKSETWKILPFDSGEVVTADLQ